MTISPSIFRAYDIRGLYPDELNEAAASNIAHAFAAFLRGQEGENSLRIALGRDTRVSSPKLFLAFANALKEEGCQVIDLGLVSTPMLYFAVADLGYDGGVMITASHNPNPWNGLKFVREKAIPIGKDSGLLEIQELAAKEYVSQGSAGSLLKQDVQDAYQSFIFDLSKVEPGELSGLHAALDAGNGTGGAMAYSVLNKAGVQVEPLHLEPDGTFPHHIPDPSRRENVEDLAKEVTTKGLGVGIALDGDADRIVFLDERGEAVPGDSILALTAELLLKTNPLEKKVLYDIRSSNSVPEIIQEKGGMPVVSKIGHAFIKATMREQDMLLGGELSGHFYWGQGKHYEAPFAVMLLVLKELKAQAKPLSEIMKRYRRYAHSGEINFETSDPQRVLKILKLEFKGKGKSSELDGLRVDFEDWWFLARPSNTEPLLRLVVEARDTSLMEEKLQKLQQLITR